MTRTAKLNSIMDKTSGSTHLKNLTGKKSGSFFMGEIQGVQKYCNPRRETALGRKFSTTSLHPKKRDFNTNMDNTDELEEVKYNLNWELPNCGGDDVFCSEEDSQNPGKFRPSVNPCCVSKGFDPFSHQCTCCWAEVYPEVKSRNMALYNLLLVAVEDAVTQQSQKTSEISSKGNMKISRSNKPTQVKIKKRDFWLSVKTLFDKKLDDMPRQPIPDKDGKEHSWSYVAVLESTLNKQFNQLVTYVSMICACRKLDEEKDDCDSDLMDLSSQTSFERRVVRASQVFSKSTGEEAQGAAGLSEKEKTDLANRYMASGSSSSSIQQATIGVLRLQKLANPKNSSLQQQNAPPKAATKQKNEDIFGETTKSLQDSTELTNQVLKAFLGQKASGPAVPVPGAAVIQPDAGNPPMNDASPHLEQIA